MKRKSPATRAQLRILKSARSALRTVTMAEKIVSKGRFSLGGEYLVRKEIEKVTSRTAFVTRTRFTDFAAGVSHGTATALRKAGLLPYLTTAAKDQAGDQIRTKATFASKSKRIRKAKRHARRQKAASEAGIERGFKQRQRVLEFIEDKFTQHERYMQTGDPRLRLSEDDYQQSVHLAYEYGFDEERIERMKESPEVVAIATAA
jgi:hypothetical protein